MSRIGKYIETGDERLPGQGGGNEEQLPYNGAGFLLGMMKCFDLDIGHSCIALWIYLKLLKYTF